MQGMDRQISATIQQYLKLFPCVIILGARQVGKSTLVQSLKQGDADTQWESFDLENQADYAQITQDPDFFLRQHPSHLIIDEVQLAPELFAALRVAIDANRADKGRFILTGSSSPQLLDATSETLAGRAALLSLNPLTFSEIRGIQQPLLVSFFNGDLQPHLENNEPLTEVLPHSIAQSGKTTDLELIEHFFFYGGYPEPWVENNELFFDAWFTQYSKTYIERDIGVLFTTLNRPRFRRFLDALASHSGEILNYSNIARLLDVSQPTIKDYLNIADGTFIWRTLPAFDKQTKKRLIKHPKGYLRDSGLMHHLLMIPNKRALMSHPQMGHSWESLVTEEFLRTLDSFGIHYRAYHYRSSGGGEVDLILEGKFGLIPIEIKFSQTVKTQQLKSIKNFIDEFNCPFGLVITNAERITYYDSKLIGIPFWILTGQK